MRSIIILSIIGMLCFTPGLKSQSPYEFNFQALALDQNHNIISEEDIKVRILITEGSPEGTLMYQEDHDVTTSATGIFNVHVGAGSNAIDDLQNIDWRQGNMWINILLDIYKNGVYVVAGSQKLLSVPYALHAETATHINDADADPQNEIQHLSLSGSTLDISSGNGVDLSTFNSPWNKIQHGIGYFNGVSYILNYSYDSLTQIDKGAIYLRRDQKDVYLNTDEFRFDPTSPSSDAGTILQRGKLSFNKLGFGASRYLELDTISMKFNYGGRAEYHKDFLRFHPDPVGGHTAYTQLDHVFLEFYNDLYSSLHQAYSSKYFGPDHYTILDNSSLAIYKGPVQNSVFNCLLKGQSLEFFSDHNITNVLIGTNQETLNGSIELFSGITGDRMAILGDHSFFPGATTLALYNNDQLTFNVSTVGGFGSANYYGQNGTQNVFVGNGIDPNTGRIEISDSFGNGIIQLFGEQDQGVIQLSHPYQDNMTLLRSNEITILSPSTSQTAAALSVVESNSNGHYGDLKLHGHNGSVNVSASGLNIVQPNDGRIDVHDSGGNPQAGFFTDQGLGYMYADIKNFRIDHPEDPDKEIWYVSLEGPEAASYVRGTAQLENGECFVRFPHHFELVASARDMTVILTPLEWDTYGLAVIEKRSDGILVKELKNGNGNFAFDWEVKCKRKGHESFQVVRNK